MKAYKAPQFSPLTYVSPTLRSWATPFGIEQLGHCQYNTLRLVAEQPKSSPVQILRREAGTCTIATASTRTTALACGKANQLPQEYLARQAVTSHTRQRLKRPCWRSAAQVTASNIPVELAYRASINCPFSWPWGELNN